METIFFATFTSEGGNCKHDRRRYSDKTESLLSFHKWIEEERLKIEIGLNTICSIDSINFIKDN